MGVRCADPSLLEVRALLGRSLPEGWVTLLIIGEWGGIVVSKPVDFSPLSLLSLIEVNSPLTETVSEIGIGSSLGLGTCWGGILGSINVDVDFLFVSSLFENTLGWGGSG